MEIRFVTIFISNYSMLIPPNDWLQTVLYYAAKNRVSYAVVVLSALYIIAHSIYES